MKVTKQKVIEALDAASAELAAKQIFDNSHPYCLFLVSEYIRRQFDSVYKQPVISFEEFLTKHTP
jgi:hypothetical protein